MHSESQSRAIEVIEEALRGLEGEERIRVILRLIESFSLEEEVQKFLGEAVVKTAQAEVLLLSSPKEAPTIASFNSPSDIAAFAAPRTIKDRALVIAAYLQVKNEKEELTAYEINKALADGGHRSTNITAALATLMETDVPLIAEILKDEAGSEEGSELKGVHSRKRYLVTPEGLERVQAMLTEFEEE